jgi:hypothetical protein
VRDTEQELLRGGLETIGGEPCFDEQMAFDMGGDGLRVSLGLFGPASVVDVIRPQTLQHHVGPPGVVPAFELAAQKRQVVKALDDRHAAQPLVLERLDDTFGGRDRSVFAHGSKTWFDVPLSQQLGKGVSGEDTGLIRNDMLRRAVSVHSLLQGLDDPPGVGSFQRKCTHDFAGEVVNGHQDLDRPQTPTPDLRGVDRPDVVGIPGGNRAGFWLPFCLRRGGRWGRRSASRFRPLQDIADCRSREKDAQQFELIGDANASPTEVGLGDFPDERGDLCGRFVRCSAGGRLIFDLVQPAIECGAGDPEVSGDLPPGNLKGLPICQRIRSLSRTLYRGFLPFLRRCFWRIETCISS